MLCNTAVTPHAAQVPCFSLFLFHQNFKLARTFLFVCVGSGASVRRHASHERLRAPGVHVGAGTFGFSATHVRTAMPCVEIDFVGSVDALAGGGCALNHSFRYARACVAACVRVCRPSAPSRAGRAARVRGSVCVCAVRARRRVRRARAWQRVCVCVPSERAVACGAQECDAGAERVPGRPVLPDHALRLLVVAARDALAAHYCVISRARSNMCVRRRASYTHSHGRAVPHKY